MKYKIFIVATLLLIFGINLNAQEFLGFKGLTVQATDILYTENGILRSINTNQVYVMSFSDKMLTHVIFLNGIINDSQIYLIENDINFMENENTVYKFETISGISGNRFYYEIKINKIGGLLSLKITQPDNITNTTFLGSIRNLKTYKQ